MAPGVDAEADRRARRPAHRNRSDDDGTGRARRKPLRRLRSCGRSLAGRWRVAGRVGLLTRGGGVGRGMSE
jgi:hypothetical protein